MAELDGGKGVGTIENAPLRGVLIGAARFSSILCVIFLLAAFVLGAPGVSHADGYPPYWDNSNGAIHNTPTPWPTNDQWIAYTSRGTTINDPRTIDPSHGGARPQNYVNVSSGCPDQSLPSVYYYYDSFFDVFYFRWRVEQIPNNYATGPAPGPYQNGSPWGAALWTVFIDTDADGFREYAMHLDGSSGIPSESVDVLRGIYSNTPHERLDFKFDPYIYLLGHNPTGFVHNGTDIIYNFQNSWTPVTTWPNGSAETIWDYGTTRSINISTPSCIEYFVDYQIPLGMLDASAYASEGGKDIAIDDFMALFFTTANSLQDPLQKDIIYGGSCTNLSLDSCVPFGDVMTLDGGIIQQPTVLKIYVEDIAGEACSFDLTTNVFDALECPCTDTVDSVGFYYYYDRNGNLQPDDPGESWTFLGSASADGDPPSEWIYSWDVQDYPKGSYLVGVTAKDDPQPVNQNVTWAHLSSAVVNGMSPPVGETYFANLSPKPGVLWGNFLSSCGKDAYIQKVATPTLLGTNEAVDFTITVNNVTVADITVSRILDLLPPGFVYNSTSAASTLFADILSSPTVGEVDEIFWDINNAIVTANGGSETLVFRAIAPSSSGTYYNWATAYTSIGNITTNYPVAISVGDPYLTLDKSASVSNADLGDSVTFTMTYANDSPANLTNVVLTDELPLGLDFVNAQDGGSYDGGTNTITWTIGNMLSGDGPYSVTFVGNVTTPYPLSAGLPLVNPATIDSTETDPITDYALVNLGSVLRPGLTISKVANNVMLDPDPLNNDNIVTFTIVSNNVGVANTTNTYILDEIPEGFVYNGATPTPTSAPAIGSSGWVRWDFPVPFVPGVGNTVTLTLEVKSPYTGYHPATNTATIYSDQTTPLSDNDHVSVIYNCTDNPTYTYYFRDASKDVGYVTTLAADANNTATITVTDDNVMNLWNSVTINGTTATVTSINNTPSYWWTLDTAVTAPSGALINTTQLISNTTNSENTVGVTKTAFLPLGSVEVELIRFYTDPPAEYPYIFNDLYPVTIYLTITRRGSPQAIFTVYKYSYDPDTGSKTLIGSGSVTTTGTATKKLYTVTFTPNGTIVPEGDRILTIITGYMGNVGKELVVDIFYELDDPDARKPSYAWGEICLHSTMIDKEVDLDSVLAGEDLTYTVDFASQGDTTLTNATITDTFPDYIYLNPSYPPALNGNSLTYGTDYTCSGQICTFDVYTQPTGVKNNLVYGETGQLVINAIVNASIPASIQDLINTAVLNTAQTTPIQDTAFSKVPPSVSIQKASDVSELEPGDTVTYTIELLNAGPTVDNVVITDTIPAKSYFTYVPGSISGGDTRDASGDPVLSWTFTQLSNGEIQNLSFAMNVATSGVPDGVTYHDNYASLIHDQSTGIKNSNVVRVSIRANAELQLTKAVSPSPGPVNALDPLTYYMTVTNIGAANALGVEVRDPIPAWTSYTAGTLTYESSTQTDAVDADNSHFDSIENSAVYAVGNLNTGQSRSMAFSVIVNSPIPDGTTRIDNTATASSRNTPPKEASAYINAVASANLTITKSAPSLLPYPLASLSATYGVANTSITIDGTQLVGVGDEISVTTTGTVVGITDIPVTYLDGDFAAASVIKVDDSGLISVGDYIILRGTVAQVTAINGGTSEWTLDTTVTGADNDAIILPIELDAGVTGNTGDPIIPTYEYTLTYTNISNAITTNTTVYDTLPTTPTALDFVSCTGGCSYSGGTLTWDLGSLQPGASNVLTARVRPLQTGTYFNNAIIAATEVTTKLSNIVNTTLGGLKPDKETSTPLVTNTANGTQATYLLTVYNQLAATNATSVIITDNDLSTGFIYNSTTSITDTGSVRTSSINPTYGDTSPSWGVWDVAASNSIVIEFVVDIANSVAPGIYQNGFQAFSSNLSVLPFDKLSTTKEDVEVRIPIDIGVVKLLDHDQLDDPCIIGCTLVWNINATNWGYSNATGVELTDFWPTELAFVNATPSSGTYNAVSHIWTVDINGGSSETLTLRGTLNSLVWVRNCIELTDSTPPDTNPANNMSCDTWIPTLISLSDFSVYGENGQVVVRWETESETGTVGFYLLRYNEKSGRYDRVNNKILPALQRTSNGGTYSIIDRDAFIGNSYTYVLVEVENTGAANSYGPFSVKVDEAGPASVQGADSKGHNRFIERGRNLPSVSFARTENRTRRSLGLIDPDKTVFRRYDPGKGAIVIEGANSAINRQQRNTTLRRFDRDGTMYIGGTAVGSQSSGGGGAPGVGGVVYDDETVEQFNDFTSRRRGMSEENRQRVRAAKSATLAATRARNRRSGTVLKIAVSEDGLYFAEAATIAELMGLTTSEVQNLIERKHLALSNMGREVAYLKAEGNAGIYFYAQGADSKYTDENIYWLREGMGLLMKTAEGDGPAPGSATGAETFTETVHAEQDTYASMGTNTIEEDYWFWEFLYSGLPGWDTKTFSVASYGAAPSPSYEGDAVLRVTIKGASNTFAQAPDHRVVVSLNGTEIGEGAWDGLDAHTIELSFDQGLLVDGENSVTLLSVSNPGVPYSLTNVNYLDLTYQRLYAAHEDSLTSTGGANTAVMVSGFTDGPGIMVFDITEPHTPVLNLAVTASGSPGDYGVSFEPASAGSRYLTLTLDAVLSAGKFWADSPSSLAAPENAAEYIVITSDALREPSERLAAYRGGRGLKSMVVLVEDIMDEFNLGLFDPQAIGEFLRHASSTWAVAPRYVLLAGKGTYDYKDNYGFGDNVVPTLMAETPFGIFATDTSYADLDGDHVPELAIGRIPAVTPEELSAVVDKTIAYESSGGPWTGEAMLMADNADTGGNFPADSDDIGEILGGSLTLNKIYLDNYSVTEARRLVKEGLERGALFVNFIGHGSVDRLALEGMLTSRDVGALGAQAGLPVLTAMTCFAANYSYPGSDTLGELLIIKPEGGMIAVWGPTGLSLNFEAMTLNREFFRSRVEGGTYVLGDMVLEATRKYGQTGRLKFMLDIYNLMGDPALELR